MPQDTKPSEKLDESSIATLREKHELGTLERITVEGRIYKSLIEVSRVAVNAVNRQKTQLTNAIKIVLNKENLGQEDEIFFEDTAYRFAVTSTEKLPVASIFKLYKDKKITEEQFLEVINVNKADAERVIGSFIVAKLMEIVPGKKADVRTRTLTDKEQTPVPIIKRKKPLESTNATPKIKPKPVLVRPGASIKPIRNIGKAKGW